jgi:hypothetical protein
MNLGKFIKSLDQFGQGVELRIKNQTKSQTIIGGILSLTMVIFLLLMFFFQAQDIFYRRNPQISLEHQVSGINPEIILDQKTFPIAIALTDYSNLALNLSRYFNFSFFLFSGPTSEYPTETQYPLVNCKKEFFPLITQASYDSLGMDNYLCIENQKLQLQGSWGEAYISYVSVRISVCKNETENGSCAPIEEIEQFIRGDIYYWNIYYQNTNINPQEPDNPNTFTMVNYYNLLKFGFRKMISIFCRRQTLESDDGFIIKSLNYDHSIAWDTFSYDESIGDESGTLVEFSIFVSPNYYIYHRAYLKIQTVLASVGGLANIFRLVFLAICYIFSDVKRGEAILNKIFDFDIQDGFSQNKILFDNNNKTVKNKYPGNDYKLLDESIKSKYSPISQKQSNISFKIRPYLKNGRVKFSDFSTVKYNNYFIRNNNKSSFSNSDIKHSNIILNSVKKEFDNSYHLKKGKSQNFKGSENLSNKVNSTKNSLGKKKYLKSMKVYEADLKFNSRLKYLKVFENFSNNEKPENIRNFNFSSPSYNNNLIKEKFEELPKMPNKSVIESEKRIKRIYHVRQLLRKFNNRSLKYLIHFSLLEIFQAFCCKTLSNKSLDLKKKLYLKSKNYIDQYLDFTFIISKLEELEKLKIVMLNTEQLALFNFVSKELISHDQNKVKNHDISIYKKFCSSKENLANVIISFKEKLNKDKILSHTDSKLYSFLNDEIKL